MTTWERWGVPAATPTRTAASSGDEHRPTYSGRDDARTGSSWTTYPPRSEDPSDSYSAEPERTERNFGGWWHDDSSSRSGNEARWEDSNPNERTETTWSWNAGRAWQPWGSRSAGAAAAMGAAAASWAPRADGAPVSSQENELGPVKWELWLTVGAVTFLAARKIWDLLRLLWGFFGSHLARSNETHKTSEEEENQVSMTQHPWQSENRRYTEEIPLVRDTIMQAQSPMEPWLSQPSPWAGQTPAEAQPSPLAEQTPMEEARAEPGPRAGRLTKVYRTRRGTKYHLDAGCRYVKNREEESLQESYVDWETTTHSERCGTCSKSKAQ